MWYIWLDGNNQRFHFTALNYPQITSQIMLFTSLLVDALAMKRKLRVGPLFFDTQGRTALGGDPSPNDGITLSREGCGHYPLALMSFYFILCRPLFARCWAIL